MNNNNTDMAYPLIVQKPSQLTSDAEQSNKGVHQLTQ